ncbi:MAG: DUF1848 domain-containing protein [Moorellales bacterium]
MKPQIISASRRTDIPAFYSPWLVNRLRAGWVLTYNPFNRKPKRVSLKAEEVAGIVFWSKNFAPLLPYLREIGELGYRCFFLFTLTGLPRIFEPATPPVEEAVSAFQALASRYTPRHLVWRYDPILLSSLTDPDYHLRIFRELCQKLEGFTERCYISFLDPYPKVRRRLSALARRLDLEVFFEPDPQLKRQLAQELAGLASQHGITVWACCEGDLLWPEIGRARCVDPELLAQLFELDPHSYPPKPTRPGCGCHESVDIGMYETCPHLCLYCYANTSEGRVLSVYRQHDPAAPALSGWAVREEKLGAHPLSGR